MTNAMWTMMSSGMRIVNFLWRVLWRNVFIAVYAPMLPPIVASSNSVFSDMRHLLRLALYLSMANAEKAMRLIIIM